MDFRPTEKQERFRSDVRAVIERNLPSDWLGPQGWDESTEDYWQFSQDFMHKLGEEGWIGLGWPKEYGGQALPYMEQFIFEDEMAYWGAPTDWYNIGTGIVAPSLMLFGSDEQKEFFIPQIARGQIWCCIGYSEPGVGSDLASLQTRAVFVIDGSKIWTTNAHRSQYCWLAARTDPEVPKHKGISVFLVDMKTPGITIQPIINMLGAHSFNQVFFDNVRIPRSALVGELNRGWYQIAAALDYERSPTFIAVSPMRRALETIVELARKKEIGGHSLASQPSFRYRVADLAVEVEVHQLFGHRVAWMLDAKRIPSNEASISKLFGSEMRQRLANTAVALLGVYGQLVGDGKWSPLKGRLAQTYMSAIAGTIGAGTSEVQRNIIAMRELKLPRA